ncbi:MmcQ/YjbR family DNA-binding protein [Kitasatospora atroaurantiaca]
MGTPRVALGHPSNVVTVIDADDVRRIALSLPETAEKEAWSMPTFRVAGKMFITVPDDQTSFAVRCPKHDRTELIAAEPEKFWVPPHEASSAWVRVRLGTLEDMAELYDILVDSWKQAAPKHLVEAFIPLGPGGAVQA